MNYPSISYNQGISAPEYTNVNQIQLDMPFHNNIDEVGGREFLNANKWPNGLQNELIKSLKVLPIRFFICDDSG